MKTKLLTPFIAAILFLMPNHDFAQPVPLGTTSDFAMFTAVGAFNNLGASTVTGDAGTDVGIFTGFPPGTLIGASHVADAVSAQAAADVEIAYSFLTGITCDSVIGNLLGSGQILTPKVYCIGSATSLTGDLTLDAQGDPTAYFVFQIDGALSTSTFSNVNLINSADVCNVYWQVNGDFILGDYSVFRGTLVANGAITLLEGASLMGRGLTRAGAIDMNNVVVTACITLPMPVTLVSFIASGCNPEMCVNLNWQTATEYNSAYFLIERSIDGTSFQTIGEHAASGNSSGLISYTFKDVNPVQGVNFYRIHQFDNNGMHEYSDIMSVHFSHTGSEMSIYPNPFTTSVNFIITPSSQLDSGEVGIYDVRGVRVMNVTVSKRITTIEMSTLPAGLYFYNLMDNRKIIQSGKLISRQ